jgi:hypothetical protein
LVSQGLDTRLEYHYLAALSRAGRPPSMHEKPAWPCKGETPDARDEGITRD